MGRTDENSKRGMHFTASHWVRWIWLLYSAFFFIEPINRHDLRHWLIFAGCYAIFLALYFGINFTRTGWQRALIAAMFLEGMLYVPFNGGALGMFVFAAAFLPFCVESISLVLLLFAGGCATIVLEAWLLHLPFWSWTPGIFFSLVVGVSNMAFAQGRRANTKLRMAQEEVEQLAKLAERERISRDLHDVLGHTLSVIVLKAELARRLLARDPDRSAVEIADVEQIARKALSDVREAIRGYRTEGLAAEIERAHRTLDAAGVSLTCKSEPPKLLPAEETVLSLIVREAVTNIVRHAQASRAVLSFDWRGGRCSMVVEDDGRGGVRLEGNGLRGIRERIEALGGHFSLDAAQGTRLVIELPVNRPNAVPGD